jgi:hypothetical protein
MGNMIEQKRVQRCANRSSRIAWCRSLQKPCDPPAEYNNCQNYQPKKAPKTTPEKTNPATQEIAEQKSSHRLLLGTKIGKCDICKATKKILLLDYGFNLCEDCIDVCTMILEHLPIDEPATNQQETDRQKTIPPKQLNIA